MNRRDVANDADLVMVRRILAFGIVQLAALTAAVLISLNPSILPKAMQRPIRADNAFAVASYLNVFLVLFVAPVLLFGIRGGGLLSTFYAAALTLPGPLAVMLWASSVSSIGYFKAATIVLYEWEFVICIALTATIVYKWRWIVRLYYGAVALCAAGFPLIWYAAAEFAKADIGWLLYMSPFYMMKRILAGNVFGRLLIGSVVFVTGYIAFKAVFITVSRRRDKRKADEIPASNN